jgi:hypothetical protein
MPVPFLLGRVAVRTGVAVWRHRLGLLVASILVMGVGAYQMTFTGRSVSSSTGDCADTAMVALTHTSEATARAAYNCLGPDMRTTSEDQFVASLQERGGVEGGQADRVADKDTPTGKIVFFTVSASRMAPVGYIVYLDEDGKVARVE